jgi:serine protease Do
MKRGLCGLKSALATALLLLAPALSLATDRELPPKLRAAFREVVAAPAVSTVQVYCDGKTAALGTIVDSAGYIVTKASELKGEVACQLNVVGGKKYDAVEVARDKSLDLAILKIDAKNLTPIVWSEGDTPGVGTWLVTPGLSVDPLTIGVLSVSPRAISAPPGALGIQLADAARPATIEEVVDGSAAEKAGLQAGDVILRVNGNETPDRVKLVETIRSYQPGETVDLLIRRKGEELTKTATLGSLAKIFGEDTRAEFQNSLGGQLSERRYGFPTVIQHDSVLKPQECGGPIVDLDGKAIGINIARAGRVESFALPASTVREAVKKMLDTHQTSTSVER